MKLTTTEIKFMNIVWNHEPICSTKLVKLCNEEFGWKKSTTYTFIKRLQEKGALINENTFVSSLIVKEVYQMSESVDIINSIYDGSLIKFLSSYLTETSISLHEANEIKKLVEEKCNLKKTVFQFDIN